jgi:hypothetical protein
MTSPATRCAGCTGFAPSAAPCLRTSTPGAAGAAGQSSRRPTTDRATHRLTDRAGIAVVGSWISPPALDIVFGRMSGSASRSNSGYSGHAEWPFFRMGRLTRRKLWRRRARATGTTTPHRGAKGPARGAPRDGQAIDSAYRTAYSCLALVPRPIVTVRCSSPRNTCRITGR